MFVGLYGRYQQKQKVSYEKIENRLGEFPINVTDDCGIRIEDNPVIIKMQTLLEEIIPKAASICIF